MCFKFIARTAGDQPLDIRDGRDSPSCAFKGAIDGSGYTGEVELALDVPSLQQAVDEAGVRVRNPQLWQATTAEATWPPGITFWSVYSVLEPRLGNASTEITVSVALRPTPTRST
jgi:hypothetical protein